MKEKCHRMKLTLTVDENNFPQISQEPITCPLIASLPAVLNTLENLDIPVIGLFDNSSIICLRDENGFNFLDSWNGKFLLTPLL